MKQDTKEKLKELGWWAVCFAGFGLLWYFGVVPYIEAFARIWAPMGIMM